MNKKLLLTTSTLLALSFNHTLLANNNNYLQHEDIVVRAENNQISTAGSASIVSQEDLELYNYQDINRVLRQVPGVEGYDEDGYGNRPNIGFRGGKSERSAGINLMEDGILIAPAPYSAPSAYYFPKVERAKEVEILKGAAAIKTGPRTTSGSLNMITKDIPKDKIAEIKTSFGSYNSNKSEIIVGQSYKNMGFLLDYNYMKSDGFKKINGKNDSGFNIKDVLAKFKITSDPKSDIYQELEIKYGYNDEVSKETYLGISEADFASNPLQRYAATAQDKFTGTHKQFQATYYIEPSENLTLATKLYYNTFKRNWYKLAKVQDTSGSDNKCSLSNVFTNNTLLDVVKGNSSTATNLDIKANNRQYDSKGIDFKANYDLAGKKTTHNIEFGTRLHYDDESRYQKTDTWSIQNGNMSLSSEGAWGSSDSNNKVIKANALAMYLSDEITLNNWTITPGVRYEHIDYKLIERVDNDSSSNTIAQFMPALAVNYKLSDKQQVFAAISKGFAPSTDTSGAEKNEESINYELGTRTSQQKINYEIVGFFNDYSNLLATCTNLQEEIVMMLLNIMQVK